MEEKDSLAVYYGKKFLEPAARRTGAGVPVDWQFTWAGHLCRIPALYVSDAGLTLDVLLFLDSGAVRTFCKKYAGWTASASRPWKSGCWRENGPSRRLPFPRA